MGKHKFNNIDLIYMEQENITLKKIIKQYEISTKLDYEKILKLKEEIRLLNKVIEIKK